MDRFRYRLRLRQHENDTGRGQRALAVTTALTSIAAVTVLLRLISRIGLIKQTGREDGVIVVSLVFSFIYLGFVAAQVHFGLGRHSASLSDQELMDQLQSLWLAIPFYNASMACSKFSILFQYLRIFPNYWFRISCYAVMGVVATYSTWAIASAFLNCWPVARFWDRSIPGSCLKFEVLWFFNASMNIVTDLTLLVMPIPVLSQLQLPRRQRFALMAVFAVGGLVVLTSILRLSSLEQVARSTDTSWSNVGAAYWTAAELNVAIICACLPFLRPIIGWLFPRLFPSTGYHRSTDGPSSTIGQSQQTGQKSQFFGQKRASRFRRKDNEYDLYAINGMSNDNKPLTGPNGCIEVTTEVVQESTKASDSRSDMRSITPV